MSALESLRKRAGMLVAGFVSFLAFIAVLRLWNGEPPVQPSGDVGILIGAAMVALYFIISDRRDGTQAVPTSRSGPSAGV